MTVLLLVLLLGAPADGTAPAAAAAAPAPDAAAATSAPAATAPTPPAAPPAPARTGVVVYLLSGLTVRGWLVAEAPSGVTVELPDGRIREVPAGEIAGTRRGVAPEQVAPPAVAVSRKDPARVRALYAPTGLQLQPGEIVVTQQALHLPSVAVGVTRWLQLQAGTALPATAPAPLHANALASVQLGLEPVAGLHVAAGVQGFLASRGTTAYLYAAAAYGTADRNVSLYAGPPLVGAAALGPVGETVYAVAAKWRVHRHLALVTEHWLAPVDGDLGLFDALAARVFLRGFAIGLGAARVPDRSLPVPWIDVSLEVRP